MEARCTDIGQPEVTGVDCDICSEDVTKKMVFGMVSCYVSDTTTVGYTGVSTRAGDIDNASVVGDDGPKSDALPMVNCSPESRKTDGVTAADKDSIKTSCVNHYSNFNLLSFMLEMGICYCMVVCTSSSMYVIATLALECCVAANAHADGKGPESKFASGTTVLAN